MTTVFAVELLFFCVVGLCLGSFSSFLIFRVMNGFPWAPWQESKSSKNKEFSVNQSHCTSCKAVLKTRDLVPLLSWVLSKGACRHCGAGVSKLYPAVELISLVASVSVYLSYGFTLSGFFVLVLIPFLLALAVIDLKTFYLPDALMKPLYIIVILYFLGAHLLFSALFEAIGFKEFITRILVGATYAFIIWGLAKILSTILKRDALGFGDVKLFGVAGICLGIAPLPVFLILCGVFGVILGIIWKGVKKSDVFPFGPAIILSFFICLNLLPLNALGLF